MKKRTIRRKCKCGNKEDYLIIEKGSIFHTTTITCMKCGRERVWIND